MANTIVTIEEVKKIAKLANLTLSQDQESAFADQFTKTIAVVNELGDIDTQNVSQTYQVNGLHNVTREDIVDTARILPQSVATSQAKNTHNGFFVVNRVIDNE